jgi:hypothetical protein
MSMHEARERLKAAQKIRAEASGAFDKIKSGIVRACTIRDGIRAERSSFDELESAATAIAIEAIKSGKEPKESTAQKLEEDRQRLEARERDYSRMIDALEEQCIEGEQKLEIAEAAVKQAIEGVQAAQVDGRLKEAIRHYEAYAAILPELNIAALRKLPVDELQQFVHVPAVTTYRELSVNNPRTAPASAMFRAWLAALELNPMAEPSEAAGAELLATERAKAAEREATERAKEEKHREKMAAMRKEQCRPQTEANEKYRREHPEDPTIGNRIPIQGYPLDPAAAVAWSVSYEGNKF